MTPPTERRDCDRHQHLIADDIMRLTATIDAALDQARAEGATEEREAIRMLIERDERGIGYDPSNILAAIRARGSK